MYLALGDCRWPGYCTASRGDREGVGSETDGGGALRLRAASQAICIVHGSASEEEVQGSEVLRASAEEWLGEDDGGVSARGGGDTGFSDQRERVAPRKGKVGSAATARDL